MAPLGCVLPSASVIATMVPMMALAAGISTMRLAMPTGTSARPDSI